MACDCPSCGEVTRLAGILSRLSKFMEELVAMEGKLKSVTTAVTNFQTAIPLGFAVDGERTDGVLSVRVLSDLASATYSNNSMITIVQEKIDYYSGLHSKAVTECNTCLASCPEEEK